MKHNLFFTESDIDYDRVKREKRDTTGGDFDAGTASHVGCPLDGALKDEMKRFQKSAASNDPQPISDKDPSDWAAKYRKESQNLYHNDADK